MTADDLSAPNVETATPSTPNTGGETSYEQSQNEAMEAAWAALNVDPQERGEDGKFKGTEANTESAELEGAAGEGEKKEEANSAVAETDVPLPANLHGLEEDWPTLPLAVRQKLAERTQELHTRMSDMGRQVSQFKPLSEAAADFAEYFNGNLKGSDGNTITPADGLRYLANIQRSMDKDPSNTLMNIIDTYGQRDQIAQLLGVQAAPVDQTNRELLSKIDRLEGHIKSLNDPSRVEQVLDDREAKAETSRLLKSDPLISEIPENRLVFFINEGWDKLGQTATREAVLKYAVNAAAEADPALRAKTQAAKLAAAGDKTKAEAAKRATGVNVTSTSTGKSRPMTDDELMSAEWAKMGLN